MSSTSTCSKPCRFDNDTSFLHISEKNGYDFQPQAGFAADMKTTSADNTYLVRVLYTTQTGQQLVVMYLPPLIKIGPEVMKTSHYVRVERGQVSIKLANEEFIASSNAGVVIPANVVYEYTNESLSEGADLSIFYCQKRYEEGEVWLNNNQCSLE